MGAAFHDTPRRLAVRDALRDAGCLDEHLPHATVTAEALIATDGISPLQAAVEIRLFRPEYFAQPVAGGQGRDLPVAHCLDAAMVCGWLIIGGAFWLSVFWLAGLVGGGQ